jgi:membrane associated rhomboid family serine protease
VLIVGVAAVLSLTGFVVGVLFFLPIVAIGGAVAAAICGVLLLLRYSRLLLAFSRKLKSV